MSDHEFRLTPVDIRAQEFRRTFFGYDREGVEDFRARVAAEMERLLRERQQLEERLESYREQLRGFREREKALNDAVVLAQQLRTDTEQAARRSSEVTLREARLKADAIIEEARAAEAAVRRDLEEAQRQFSAYLSAFRQLLLRHLAQLDALEEHERDGSPPGP